MNSVEYSLGNAKVIVVGDDPAIRENPDARRPAAGYDLDLMYVECRFCGSPILWDKGKTGILLRASGIDTSLLDAECLILSEGCPQCRPGVSPLMLHVVRLASQQDMLLLALHKGHA